MRIDDKDELKRCIRAAVRGLPLPDVLTRLNIAAPRVGLDAMLGEIAPDEAPEAAFSRLFIENTPLRQTEQDVVTALDRLGMPQGDRQVACLRAQSMTPDAYLTAVCEQVGWSVALSPVTPENCGDARAAAFLQPSLDLDACMTTPGRYGERYRAQAERLSAFVREQKISHAALSGADGRMLNGEWMRCLALPLCEDERLILCIGLKDKDALTQLAQRMDEYPALRVAAWCCEAADEPALIGAAQRMNHLAPCIRPASISLALDSERPRFLPYPSYAAVADFCIGYFRRLRAETARALYERYLPLLRSGFVLTDHTVAQDIVRMTVGAWTAIHDEY